VPAYLRKRRVVHGWECSGGAGAAVSRTRYQRCTHRRHHPGMTCIHGTSTAAADMASTDCRAAARLHVAPPSPFYCCCWCHSLQLCGCVAACCLQAALDDNHGVCHDGGHNLGRRPCSAAAAACHARVGERCTACQLLQGMWQHVLHADANTAHSSAGRFHTALAHRGMYLPLPHRLTGK
jgi:hypothetical protein